VDEIISGIHQDTEMEEEGGSLAYSDSVNELPQISLKAIQ
jgi:hypothetical protein